MQKGKVKRLIIAEKHYLQAYFYFSLSICLNPKYSLLRAWNRKFSPDARKWLKKDNVKIRYTKTGYSELIKESENNRGI